MILASFPTCSWQQSATSRFRRHPGTRSEFPANRYVRRPSKRTSDQRHTPLFLGEVAELWKRRCRGVVRELVPLHVPPIGKTGVSRHLLLQQECHTACGRQEGIQLVAEPVPVVLLREPTGKILASRRRSSTRRRLVRRIGDNGAIVVGGLENMKFFSLYYFVGKAP